MFLLLLALRLNVLVRRSLLVRLPRRHFRLILPRRHVRLLLPRRHCRLSLPRRHSRLFRPSRRCRLLLPRKRFRLVCLRGCRGGGPDGGPVPQDPVPANCPSFWHPSAPPLNDEVCQPQPRKPSPCVDQPKPSVGFSLPPSQDEPALPGKFGYVDCAQRFRGGESIMGSLSVDQLEKLCPSFRVGIARSRKSCPDLRTQRDATAIVLCHLSLCSLDWSDTHPHGKYHCNQDRSFPLFKLLFSTMANQPASSELRIVSY